MVLLHHAYLGFASLCSSRTCRHQSCLLLVPPPSEEQSMEMRQRREMRRVFVPPSPHPSCRAGHAASATTALPSQHSEKADMMCTLQSGLLRAAFPDRCWQTGHLPTSYQGNAAPNQPGWPSEIVGDTHNLLGGTQDSQTRSYLNSSLCTEVIKGGTTASIPKQNTLPHMQQLPPRTRRGK